MTDVAGQAPDLAGLTTVPYETIHVRKVSLGSGLGLG